MKLLISLLGLCAAVLAAAWMLGAVKAGLFIRDTHAFASQPDESPLEAFSREKKFVDVGPWRVAYIDRGTGEPLVLLHGCPFQSFEYSKIHGPGGPLPARGRR